MSDEEQNLPQSEPPDTNQQPDNPAPSAQTTTEEGSEEAVRDNKSLGGPPRPTVRVGGNVNEQYVGDHGTHFHGTVYLNPEPQDTLVQTQRELLEINHQILEQLRGSSNRTDNSQTDGSPDMDSAEKREQDVVKGKFKRPFPGRLAADEEDDKTPAMLQSDDDIIRWYDGLSSYEQCFVQAMAIFSGASNLVLRNATAKLYAPFNERNWRYKQQSASQKVGDEQIGLSPELLIYIDFRRVAKIECCYWKDDRRGSSQFQVRLLQFFARGVLLRPDNVFVEQLEAWAEELEDGNEAQALWALGIVWWHYANRLQDTADLWAATEEWYRSAYLLYGAYEMDCMRYKASANDPAKSPVLHLVQQWTRKSRQSRDANRGCAAALTYMLIGNHALPESLRGLDSLLEPSRSRRNTNDPEEIKMPLTVYESVVLSYSLLAADGSMKEVVHHLAQRIEITSHQRLQLTEMTYSERVYHRMHRQLTIISALDTFFRLVVGSFSNLSDDALWVNYDPAVTFPSRLTLDNGNERDVFLWGILQQDAVWCSDVRTLLCAALMENISDFKTIVYSILSTWSNLVLKDQSSSPSQVRESYIQFIVELEQAIHAWRQRWIDLEFQLSPPSNIFERLLSRWEREGQMQNTPIKELAQEITSRLSA